MQRSTKVRSMRRPAAVELPNLSFPSTVFSDLARNRNTFLMKFPSWSSLQLTAITFAFLLMVKQDPAKRSPWKVSCQCNLFLATIQPDNKNESTKFEQLIYEGGDSDANEGMIPRSVRLIFATCNELKSKGWTYKIEASFLEIYNEQIRDLLGNGSSNHEIRLVNNEVVVTNLRVSIVTHILKNIYLDFSFSNS